MVTRFGLRPVLALLLPFVLIAAPCLAGPADICEERDRAGRGALGGAAGGAARDRADRDRTQRRRAAPALPVGDQPRGQGPLVRDPRGGARLRAREPRRGAAELRRRLLPDQLLLARAELSLARGDVRRRNRRGLCGALSRGASMPSAATGRGGRGLSLADARSGRGSTGRASTACSPRSRAGPSPWSRRRRRRRRPPRPRRRESRTRLSRGPKIITVPRAAPAVPAPPASEAAGLAGRATQAALVF